MVNSTIFQWLNSGEYLTEIDCVLTNIVRASELSNSEAETASFLGGIDKSRVLGVLKPHIFFDDQMVHLEKLKDIPAVHIPFGVANK